MPPRGGAFFGFAIIIAVALITWGIIALVEVADDSNDSNDTNDSYDTSRDDDSELQTQLNNASPGDTIYIPEGTHYVSLTTAVDGTEDEPITIRNQPGVDRADCVLKGDDRSRVLEILHNYYIIEGFTVDGDDGSDEYREQLIYVEGSRDPSEVNGVQSALTGVQILGMSVINAAKECIRLRYFVTDCLVQANDIGPCGIEDFQQGSDGSNGEGVYIGTALNQIDDKNGDDVVDVCTGITVADNDIDTQGSEGVDIKEGSYGNLVYRNTIRGQMDPETGGISLRGDDNIVLENNIIDGEGACIRISGHEYDDVDYGQNNEVYENTLDGCRHSAIKVNESPQIICENYVTAVTDPTDDEEYAVVRGDAAADYVDTVSNDCPADLSTVTLPADYDGEEDDDEEETVVEEDDDEQDEIVDDDGELEGSSTVIIDGDDDLHEEDDDTAEVRRGLRRCNGGMGWGSSRDDGRLREARLGKLNTHAECFRFCERLMRPRTCCVRAFSTFSQGARSTSVFFAPYTLNLKPVVSPFLFPLCPDPLSSFSSVANTEEEVVDNDDETTVATGSYLGCYKDDDNFPILDFLYEDEEDLTPASCIEDCRAEGEELAGLQGGSQCWCGTTDDYDQYGTDSCSYECTGNSALICGDRAAASVWTVD
ncbi:unnamed protein product [Scytosiphon promiscuus]